MAQGKLFYWVANWNLSRAQAARLLGGEALVADMVDCMGSRAAEVVKAYPAIKRFACYITGTDGIAWTDAEFALLSHDDVAILEIDQSDADRPIIDHRHVKTTRDVAKDDESGAATNTVAVNVARELIDHGEDYVIYCTQANLAAVEADAVRAGLPHGEIIAYQYASPTSNPGSPLPGTPLTLKEANADLSVVHKSFLPVPGQAKPEPKPAPPPAHPTNDPRLDYVDVRVSRDPAGDSWRAEVRDHGTEAS